MYKLKDSVEGPWGYPRELLVLVANHCESLAAACLSIGKDTDIKAIHSRLYQVLLGKIIIYFRSKLKITAGNNIQCSPL